MRGVPGPGGGDDGVDVRVLHLPPELGHGLGRVRIQRGRIAGATRGERVRHLETADLLHRADHFEDGGGLARAEVVEALRAGRLKLREDRDVCAAQVVDVDVVAQAGAVRRRVVVAKDLQGWAASGGRIDRQRDKVRLGIMVLADRAIGRGPRGVEVAKGGKAQAVGGRDRRQRVLEVELGLAIRVDGAWGELSTMGIFAGMPKVAQVEENTNFFTPMPIMQRSRWSGATTLLK